MEIYAIMNGDGVLVHRPSRGVWRWGGSGVPRFWVSKKICANQLDRLVTTAAYWVEHYKELIQIEESQPPEHVRSTHLPHWKFNLAKEQTAAAARIVYFEVEGFKDA